MQDAIGKAGACVDKVLAVIEYEKQAAIAQELEQGVDEGALRFRAHAEYVGYRRRHARRIRHRGKVDEPGTPVVVTAGPAGDLLREASLTYPAGSYDAEQRSGLEQLNDDNELVFATDKRPQV